MVYALVYWTRIMSSLQTWSLSRPEPTVKVTPLASTVNVPPVGAGDGQTTPVEPPVPVWPPIAPEDAPPVPVPPLPPVPPLAEVTLDALDAPPAPPELEFPPLPVVGCVVVAPPLAGVVPAGELPPVVVAILDVAPCAAPPFAAPPPVPNRPPRLEGPPPPMVLLLPPKAVEPPGAALPAPPSDWPQPHKVEAAIATIRNRFALLSASKVIGTNAVVLRSLSDGSPNAKSSWAPPNTWAMY